MTSSSFPPSSLSSPRTRHLSLAMLRRLVGPVLLAMTLGLSGCASQMASDNAGDLTRNEGDWQQQSRKKRAFLLLGSVVVLVISLHFSPKNR